MSLLSPDYSLLALIAAFLAGIVAGRLTAVTVAPRSRRTRTRDIDRKLDAADMLALLPPETRSEIDTLVADDRKIEAIRVCRAALNLGLIDAKEIVDLIETQDARGERAP